MSKPTSGPWEIETFPDGSFEIYTKPNEFVICKRAESQFPEETKANAKLIAAAPELYKLLLEVVEDGLKTNMKEWQTRARHSIAKAQG